MNDLIFLQIPYSYKKPYLFLLQQMAKFGEDLLKDCNANCSQGNSRLVQCWNMFNAACAAYAINNIKLANLLINYVESQLKNDYLDEYNEFVIEEDDPSNRSFNSSFNQSFK